MHEPDQEGPCECLVISEQGYGLMELAAYVFSRIAREDVRHVTVMFEPEDFDRVVVRFCSMVHHLLSRHGISSELKRSDAPHGFTHFVSGTSTDFLAACWVSPKWEYLQLPQSG